MLGDRYNRTDRLVLDPRLGLRLGSQTEQRERSTNRQHVQELKFAVDTIPPSRDKPGLLKRWLRDLYARSGIPPGPAPASSGLAWRFVAERASCERLEPGHKPI